MAIDRRTMAEDSARPLMERRKNPILRALINEMLERVRELNRNATHWTPEERQRAEEELNVILARVRGAATDEGGESGPEAT